ncbi:M20 metallopeptidase family protein [Abyssalbus ytuae]|uniref:M20 family metallopeptidase n=1 Tax=Abyssalbus ytuae TaxID=2926907 RepID=A0A9E6ZR10_9FLAO|nr:M20 family metallopeptidase [Abyssalbus ytuae]UOB18905.1 M20 family metallopeptidase [Abyssalbus ytuae]
MNYLNKGLKLAGYICSFLMMVPGWGQIKEGSVHETIQHQTESIFDSLVQIRRNIHEYPEVAGNEKRTSALVKEYLLRLGMEVKTNIGGYGVVGILKGDKKGKKIAWRADMDALSSDIAETSEFASNNKGVRHICGHDVHTTIALGMANVLAGHKDKIQGTVYFIFQPSEENYQGAQAMINDGLYEIISPDEIYATHISPMPSGLVATKSGYLFADYKQINITYKGSNENESVIKFTENLVSDLQNVAAESKFRDTRNLMDSDIGIGNPSTIYKNYLTVGKHFETKQKDKKLTVSAFLSASSKELMDSVPAMMRQKIEQSEFAGLLLDIEYSSPRFEYSTERGNILNDEHLTPQSIETLAGIYGKSSIIPLFGVIPDGRGDDFAYFQEKTPGIYFLLGGSDFQKEIIAMPHSPNFMVDEQCIKTGVNYFSSMIWERLNTP